MSVDGRNRLSQGDGIFQCGRVGTGTGEDIGKIIRGEPLGEDDDTPGSSIPSVTAIPRTGEVKPATGEGDRAPA